MAQPTNTFDTYDSVGNRESLSDVIYNISPTETPFMSMIGRGKAKATYEEWQIDTLASVDTGNARVEGDDAALQSTAPTTRVGNRCQISDKTLVVSGTQDEVSKAGRKRELAYQIVKRGKELRRDMEAILSGNQATVAGDNVTARVSASLEAWIETNGSRDATTGADGGFGTTTPGIVDIATDSSATRPLTENMLKSVISDAWTQGGSPTVIMCGPINKQNISAFTGGSTKEIDAEGKKLVAAIDTYVSDFGTHRVVPNRFSRDRTVSVISPKLWKVLYLRSFRQQKLAVTGDSRKRQLIVEYCLCSKNEAGSGTIADLTV